MDKYKYTFVNACHKDFEKIQYGYVLELKTIEDLINYHTVKQLPDLTKSMANLNRALETNSHASDPIANHIQWMAKFTDDSISIVDITTDLIDSMTKGQLEVLKNGPLYIHKNGSYMGGEALKILSRMELDDLIWPTQRILTSADVKITKWFGGNHYYVTVDEVSLGKFNTPDYAAVIAKAYIDLHNEKLNQQNGQ